MKHDAPAAKVLIATDNADDAAQLRRQLTDEFDNIRTSTDASRYVADFEAFQPDVLVLAFDALARAQQYYLGLYRGGSVAQQHPHRTIILCTKDEVQEVYALCKRSYFDDYVLYWPHTFDGPRLAMTIWAACREMAALARPGPKLSQLIAHASDMGALESALGRHVAGLGQGEAALRSSAESAEAALAADLADFSARLQTGGDGAIEVRDAAALARAIDTLQRRQAESAQSIARHGLDTLRGAAQALQRDVAPVLAEARQFTQAVAGLRAQVLVVDDEAMVRELITRFLATRYEVVAAGSAAEALGLLRRVRPDVALVDLHMPGLDGVQLTSHIKASQQWHDLPVLIITGDARRETLADSLAAGATGFIVKPFTGDALLSKVEQALRAVRPEPREP